MPVTINAPAPPHAGSWVRERWWVPPVATQLPAWNTKWHLASGDLLKRASWDVVRVVTACGRRLPLEWRKDGRLCIELARREPEDNPVWEVCTNCARIAARRTATQEQLEPQAVSAGFLAPSTARDR